MEQHPCAGGGRVAVARTVGQRLVGLAGLAEVPADRALLIPGCASVHTAWMRVAIDVVFLDAEGGVLRVVPGLAPWRMAGCHGARAVVETAAGCAEALGFGAPRATNRI